MNQPVPANLESQKKAGLERLGQYRDRLRKEEMPHLRDQLKGEADGSARMLRCLGVISVAEMDEEMIATLEVFNETDPRRVAKLAAQA